jgi:glycosyltransferase involved in cell wall biosynthesis
MSGSATVHLVMMTFNRLEYTREALPALLRDPQEPFALTLWDNGSTDGTREYLQTVRDPRIVDLVFSEENRGQTWVTNKIWSESDADLVGKVDNDCVVTPGWTRTLARAHADLPELGVVGCWHFFEDDFDYERARHKIQRFGAHQILRHPWIDGSALLVKRRVFLENGPCGEQEYLSGFWKRLALKGYVNGFYYPLILQDHLDDPLHPRCLIREEGAFDRHRAITQGLKAGRYADPEGRIRWRQEIVRNLLDDPWDPRAYVGWRDRWRRWRRRLRLPGAPAGR